MSILYLYIVYERPLDFPNGYVVRRTVVEGSKVYQEREAQRFASLEQARQVIPPGAYNIGRQPDDDPAIKEVWI